MSYYGPIDRATTYVGRDGSDIYIFDYIPHQLVFGWDSMNPLNPLYTDNLSRKTRRRGYATEEALRDRIIGVKIPIAGVK